MLVLEPIFWCWGSGELFEEDCPASHDNLFLYSVIGMVAMFIYFMLLMVLAVFNMTVSAYVLVCQRMVAEVGLFLFALACVIFMTAPAASASRSSWRRCASSARNAGIASSIAS